MKVTFKKDGEWFFWDEVCIHLYGPFMSEYSAELALAKYRKIDLLVR